MRALVLHQVEQPLAVDERADLEPGPDEAVVEVRAAALNRRDYWISRGLYPGVRLPSVLGSDGAGTVSRVGSAVDPEWVGEAVVIDPSLDWGTNEAVQADGYRILGMPDDGTLATEVLVPAQSLHPRPAHLDWRQAAALPLAGLTAFRALFRRGGLKAGEKVLVTGAGGGVGTFAVQFAVAAGAAVFVTSSSRDKIRRAVELGATAGVSYRDEGWGRALRSEHGAVDLVIDGAGGAGFNQLIGLASPGGRIVSYGSTAGAPGELDLFKVFWKQLNLLGSTMGSPADFEAMLQLVNGKRLEPIIDEVYPFEDANRAFDAMQTSTQFGKLVIDVP